MVVEVRPMQIPGEAPVVVGANGTAAGLAAVRLAAREAVARGRELRVVHAFTWPKRGAADLEYAPARHAAARIVEQAVTTARRSTPGAHVSGTLVDGLPARVLLQLSRGADLIVLGDDDLATVTRLPLDSVLLQVVSRSWCPVVVARGLRPPVGRLLVAVDGSPTALLALRYAATEAQRRDIGVEVVHVIERAGGDPEKAGRRVLTDALTAVPELTGARTRLLIGDPAIALIRASRHARMIIVGPRGRDGAALLGPVAHELLRRCACPTVFVHGTSADDGWSAGAAPPPAESLTT
jgi:nucleotide-binding universal stress UspA family protein